MSLGASWVAVLLALVLLAVLGSKFLPILAWVGVIAVCTTSAATVQLRRARHAC